MDNWRRNTRHNAGNRLPVERPARTEIRVRQGYHDQHAHLFDEENEVVCDCFPRTSNFAIPTMFYDKIVCPHQRQAHIQPAQETHFDYPWTPSSIIGKRKQVLDQPDDLSERLSLLSSDLEDEQLRFTPALIDRRPGDVQSVATAPPYWYEHETDPRTHEAPFTAPPDYEIRQFGLEKPKRALSMRDLRDPAYRSDAQTHRRALTQNGQRNSRLSNRQFTGSYVDPKDGRVYKYNVNYDGTPQPKGTREPVAKTRDKMDDRPPTDEIGKVMSAKQPVEEPRNLVSARQPLDEARKLVSAQQ